MINSNFLKKLFLSIAVAILVILVGIGKEQAAVGQALISQLASPFSSFYSLVDLGSVPQLPIAYAGLTFQPNAPNTLMIGGAAVLPDSGIYSVRVRRNSNNQIIGFGTASLVTKSPGLVRGGIDAGLTYSPKGDALLYTTYDDNTLGQVKSGGRTVAKKTDLNTINIAPSTGALTFVPKGFSGANRLKITSYTANLFYDTTISSDGSGTYNIAAPSKSVALSGGIDSFVYVKAGNQGFSKDSLLMTEYDTKKVSAYTIDTNGDPVATTRRDFITGITSYLPTALTTLGATVDPLTGDVLISTYFEEAPSKGKIIAVRGFKKPTSCPSGQGDDDDDDCGDDG